MNTDMFMGPSAMYRSYVPSYISANNSATTNIVWTMGVESAKAYPVPPGRTILLMDSESPRFFIKTVDANGYAAMKVYNFQEEVAAVEEPVAAKYVTQEQLQAALEAFAADIQKSKSLL